MHKGTKSASLLKSSKPKGSALGRRIIAGLKDAIAHRRGELELESYSLPRLKRGQLKDPPSLGHAGLPSLEIVLARATGCARQEKPVRP
jgi:hypothetical protein